MKPFFIKCAVLIVLIIFTTTNMIANERHNFYSALSDDSLENVESLIQKIEKQEDSSLRKAYIGALYMKQAELLKVPAKKLNAFKKGHKLLENEILKNPKNIEYRFLRFIIQKNAPNFLHYNNNIEEDKNLIANNFSSLNPTVQDFIIKYNKSKGVFNIEKLKK